MPVVDGSPTSALVEIDVLSVVDSAVPRVSRLGAQHPELDVRKVLDPAESSMEHQVTFGDRVPRGARPSSSLAFRSRQFQCLAQGGNHLGGVPAHVAMLR